MGRNITKLRDKGLPNRSSTTSSEDIKLGLKLQELVKVYQFNHIMERVYDLILAQSSELANIDITDEGKVGIGTSASDSEAWLVIPASAVDISSLRLELSAVDHALPKSGDVWMSSTRNALMSNINSTKVGMVGSIFAQTASVSVSNTVAETTLIGAGVGTVVFGAEFFTDGKTILVKASGTITNTGTPTFRIRLRTTSGVAVDSGAITMSTITGTMSWFYEGVITCRSTGSGGTIFSQHNFMYYTNSSTLRGATVPATATTTLNTTIAQTLNLTAIWGAASSSNTIICTNFTVTVL